MTDTTLTNWPACISRLEWLAVGRAAVCLGTGLAGSVRGLNDAGLAGRDVLV